MTNQPRAVLWDMDGTLLDSAEYHWLAWRAQLAAEGSEVSHEYFLKTFGQRNDTILRGHYGEDFPLDLDLVEQIEIVRGPSSALYGGNGVFATINIITQTPAGAPQRGFSTAAGTLGERKLAASTSLAVGREGHLLLSTAASHSSGRTVNFAEREQAGLSPSRTDHVGAGAGYRLFANLAWKDWTVVALFGQHKSIVPSG